MDLLSNSNTKLKRDGIFHFSIPAFQSADGFKTCPGAKDCIKGCYAVQGFHGMSWVKNAKERRLEATRQHDFVYRIYEEIKRRKVKILRIHDAGDFYSAKYRYDWMTIIHQNPEVQFYAYTKMVPHFKGLNPYNNFKIIFSYGGIWDHVIDHERDPHSIVFPDHESLMEAGYDDATESDLVALWGHKIGLVYHGGKNLKWSKIPGGI